MVLTMGEPIPIPERLGLGNPNLEPIIFAALRPTAAMSMEKTLGFPKRGPLILPTLTAECATTGS